MTKLIVAFRNIANAPKKGVHSMSEPYWKTNPYFEYGYLNFETFGIGRLCYELLYFIEGSSLHADCNNEVIYISSRLRGSAVFWDSALQAGRSRARFLTESLQFFIGLNLPATMLLESTHHLTDINTMDLSWG
jgi:hypothetical protein